MIMETKRNKFNEQPQKKGGKDMTNVVLTAAGASIVGAGGALGAAELLNDGKTDEEELDIQMVDEELEQEELTAQVEDNAEEQAQQTAAQHTAQNQNQQPVHEPEEMQPVDNGAVVADNGNTAPSGNNGQQTGNETPADPALDDVDPNLIAQEITTVEVDPNDVDVADMISVDSVGTAYTEDGHEMGAAAVHTSDGGQYLMIDVDNDMTFDVITDLEGNPVVAVDGNLTMSDIEDMMDDTGGELAFDPGRDEMELAGGENPENGIVDTEDDYLAMGDRIQEGYDEEDEQDVAFDDEMDDSLAMDDAVMDDDII